MKNALCYSIFGSNPMYCVGALRNAELAKINYPGWQCIFWYDESVPTAYVDELSSHENVRLIKVNSEIPGRYWRFNAFNEDVDLFCIRDTDSRITEREVHAVKEWIDSKMTFHVMRDHPHHNFLVMAGMWGFKKKQRTWDFNNNLKSWISSIKQPSKIDDTMFLEKLYRDMNDDIIVHDDWKRCKYSRQFPVIRSDQRFVGEIFDENERYTDHYKLIR